MAADVQIHIGAMFDDFNKAIFDAKTKLTGLGDEMDKAFARMDKASKNVTKLGESLSMKLMLPLMALGGLAVKSFAESEQASMKLDSALRSAGDTSLASKEGINKLADELKELTAVDDDVVKGLVQVGLQMGLTIPQAKAAAKDAIGLSKAFGVDLDGAMRMCGQAYQGNIEKLARYIPALKTAGSEAEKQAIYQKAMASAFETAKAAAESPVGSYKKLAQAVDDLGKGMGKIISEYIGPFIITLSKMVDEFNNADESTKTVIVTVAALAAGIGPLLIIIGKAISLYRTMSIVVLAFSAGMKGNTIALGANSASLAANRIGMIAHSAATKAATAAQWLFNAACAANPMVLIGVAAVAAAGSIAFVTKRFMESREEAKNLQQTINEIKSSKLDFGSKEAADRQYLSVLESAQKMKDSGKSMADIVRTLSDWHDKALSKYNSAADKASQAAQYQLNWTNATKRAIEVIQSANNQLNDADRAQMESNAEARKKWWEEAQAARQKYVDMSDKLSANAADAENTRYQKDLEEFKKVEDQKYLNEYAKTRAREAIEKTHEKNMENINASSSKEWESAWKNAFSSNIDVAEKFRQINKAVADGTLSGWQGTAAKIAATVTSAFAAASNAMNALFSAQTQAAEDKYSKLSAEEEAYQAYEDQKSAQEYKRMSGKEKKEADLKAAADKAKLKRENDLARAKTAIQRKSAIMGKITGIAEATISTFTGAARALKDFPFPASAIIAALVTALGLAQVAAIAATPLPSTSLAWGGATTGRTVAEIGEAGREVVMPLDSQYGQNAIGILVDKMWAGLEARAAYASRNSSSSASVQQQIAAASSAQGGGATELSVTLMLDPIKLGEAVTMLGDRGYYRIPARVVV